MKRAKIIAAIAACAILMGGCGTRGMQSEMPVGIGSGTNQLKSSPCACILQPNAANSPVAG